MQQEAAPLVNESFLVAELASLLTDPIYYGIGVPRGDGRLVLVLPGFFVNDWYLYPLHSWLRRVGFRPVHSSLAINAGCPERLTRQVEQELDRQRRRRPGPVALIGHSGGGILARAMAARLQDEASHLILLGAPVGAIMKMEQWPAKILDAPVASLVAETSRRARRVLDPDCDVPYCRCPFPVDLRGPLSPHTKVVSIHTRDDPIVPAWACSVPGAENVEVSGTHSGLAYNRAVYRELAAALN